MRFLLMLFLAAVLLFGDPAGKYAGTWASNDGVKTGKVNLSLSAAGEGWQSDLTFTYQDQEIKPNKVTAKVEAEKIEFVCEQELEGYKLRTTFTGTIDGKGISGKYQTISVDDGAPLDGGTWKVAQQ